MTSTPISGITKPDENHRRSTLARKRDASDDMPQSPSKRVKVTFDNEVQVLSADEEPETDPKVVREQVRRAIQRHLAGDDESYDHVCSIFKADANSDNAPSPKSLHAHLQAALTDVSSLNMQCSKLVNAILFHEWVGRDSTYVSLFTIFLGNLSVAHTGFLRNIFNMLGTQLAVTKTKRLKGYKAVSAKLVHDRSHGALRYLVGLIPTASGALAACLTNHFRYNSTKADDDVLVTKNLLKILSYAPELRGAILSFVITEVVRLDSRVQVDMEENEDMAVEDLLADQPSSQTYVAESSQSLLKDGSQTPSADSDSDDESELDEDIDEEILRRRNVKVNITKMDGMMGLLFQYYEICFQDPLARSDIQEILFAHFRSIILPTYRSRHSQFLLFHFVQTSDVLMDRFASICVDMIFDRKESPITRQAASAYLASFVSRGAHVRLNVVQDCFALLTGLLNDLREEHAPTCQGPNLMRYGPFYALAQALLYIFCFRWQDLCQQEDVGDEEDADEPRKYIFPEEVRIPLWDAIMSKLNPLKICSPVIVQEFARIAHHTQLMYLWGLIETNKRLRLMTSRRSLADLSSNINQPSREMAVLGDGLLLDAYFPFDPYTLPKSKHWVEADYRAWQPLEGSEQGDEESSGDESDGQNSDAESDANDEEEDSEGDSDDED
ncbi:MAG: hypothetical protein Q9160_004943 [Pyrenula sp. 1 TL-2023]